MKPKVLITRKIFDEVLGIITPHFEVEENPSDAPLSPQALRERLRDKHGVIVRLTDRIDDEILSHCSELKVISNIAVGYNNIDVEACTRRRIIVTNTPGVSVVLAIGRREQRQHAEERG